ncbi:hypothetical protein KKI23_03845 [Patescibacteria group bacterium]|nr:hypothetical protein [Patescibacteria group bacterium]
MTEKQTISLAVIIACVIVLGIALYTYPKPCQQIEKIDYGAVELTGTACSYDQHCEAGYTCFVSEKCEINEGGEEICLDQEGDSTCHKDCLSNADCDQGQSCQEKTIWREYDTITKSLCI